MVPTPPPYVNIEIGTRGGLRVYAYSLENIWVKANSKIIEAQSLSMFFSHFDSLSRASTHLVCYVTESVV